MTDSVPVQKFERRPIQVGMSDGIKIASKAVSVPRIRFAVQRKRINKRNSLKRYTI